MGGEVMRSITSDLRALVDRYLLDVLGDVVDGVTCGPLSGLYEDMVSSLCFQGVWGLIAISRSMVWASSTVLVLLIVVYVVWRRSVDNVNAEEAKIDEWLQQNV